MFWAGLILGGVTQVVKKHFELREREVRLKEVATYGRPTIDEIFADFDFNSLTPSQKIELLKLLSDTENHQP